MKKKDREGKVGLFSKERRKREETKPKKVNDNHLRVTITFVGKLQPINVTFQLVIISDVDVMIYARTNNNVLPG